MVYNCCRHRSSPLNVVNPKDLGRGKTTSRGFTTWCSPRMNVIIVLLYAHSWITVLLDILNTKIIKKKKKNLILLYDSRIKTMFGSSLPTSFFVREPMSNLRTIFVFACEYCVVILFVPVSLVYPVWPVYLDCQFFYCPFGFH
jgi:hypothetical protein